MDNIYLSINGENYGPYQFEEIKAMLQNGQISADTPAWHEGMAEWQPLNTLLSAPHPMPEKKPKKWLKPLILSVAAVLVLVLGGIGGAYFFGKNSTKNSEQAKSNVAEKTPQQLFDEAMKYAENNDFARALPLFRKAAEQGHAKAQYNLGVCYYAGIGVTKDYKQAVYWWRKAAEQGDADAQYNLGVCYEKGYGVDKDYNQAVYWYRKAAEQGDAYAQNDLGYCYYAGNGVAKDLQQAAYWWRKAAEQGHANAREALKILGVQ